MSLRDRIADCGIYDALLAYANDQDIDVDDAVVELVRAALKPKPAEVDYLEMPVRITRDAVYFGDEKIPGCIRERGVVLKPGGDSDINELTITFLVGEVTADDPWVTSTPEPLPPTRLDRASYRFSSKQPPIDLTSDLRQGAREAASILRGEDGDQ